MKKVFSNSLFILSYKFLKKSGAVNEISCTYFVNHELRKTYFSLKNVIFGPETVPKAISDPQIFYESVFINYRSFKENG